MRKVTGAAGGKIAIDIEECKGCGQCGGVVPAEVPGTGFCTTTLNEIPADRNICIKLEEALIPVQETVQSACEILGLDLLICRE